MKTALWHWLKLQPVRGDLKYAVRQLWRNPGFTGTVLLTLALAIGANTAIFSIVNALLLKSLPYAQPERIGSIYARTAGPAASDTPRTIDGEQWELLRDDVPALLPAISGMRTSGVNLRAGSHVQYVHGGRISAHYLDVLGLAPALGRKETIYFPAAQLVDDRLLSIVHVWFQPSWIVRMGDPVPGIPGPAPPSPKSPCGPGEVPFPGNAGV